MPVSTEERFSRGAALSQIFEFERLPGDETAFKPLKKLLRQPGIAEVLLKPPAHHIGKVETKARNCDEPDATELTPSFPLLSHLVS